MRFVRSVTFCVVLAFSVTLFDYLVLANFGVRMLPLDYETLETTFFVLAALSLAGALLSTEGAKQVALHRLVFLSCVPSMLATAAGFLGGSSWFFDLFAHFRAQYAGSLLLGALVLFVLRKARWASVTASFALVNVVVMAPQLAGWPTAVASGDPSLRMVLANVNVSNRHYDAVVDFIEAVDPDVFVLEEIDPRWVEETAELGVTYPHSVVAAHSNNFGIGVFSRMPLEAQDVVHLVDENIPSIAARIDVSGTDLVLLATHPLPPRDAVYSELRDRQLDALAALARDGGAHVVVLGDLNTTPWGHSFRSLLSKSGLEDSSRGRGLQWSWPAGFWPLAIPIDHCLVSRNVQVVDRFMGPDIGSDHYPLVVDVSLTPPGSGVRARLP